MSNPRDYTIGWICALKTEYVAARLFLDEAHDAPEHVSVGDNNVYTLGRMGGHNVVIAVLPDGEYGLSSAARVASDMQHSFPNMRIGLMVGIGGGAPTPKHDIRLGDVVVSTTKNGNSCVLQYDFGKKIQGQKFQLTGSLNQPPALLRAAVCQLQAKYEESGHQLGDAIAKALGRKPKLKRYKRLSSSSDTLYRSNFTHPLNNNESCLIACDISGLISRPPRTEDDDDPMIHYGRIASANSLMKDALERDQLAEEEDILFDKKMDAVSDAIGGVASMQQEGQHREIFRWLSPIDPFTRQSDFLRRRQKGTGEWFLETPQFKQWLEGKEKTLFCPGIPGAGKTMIASIVSDKLKAVRDQDAVRNVRTGVAFIYCIYNEREQQSLDDILASILVQLVLGQPVIPESVQKVYKSHRKGEKPRLSLDEISKEITAIIKCYSRIFIVVDALDECRDDDIRKSLLSKLFELQTVSDIRLMVTFRPGAISEALIKTRIEIRAQNEDLEIYLRNQMSKLPDVVTENHELQNKIKDRISYLARGMFLLAQLYINSLADKLTENAIDIALKNMRAGEKGLDEAYDAAVQRIESQLPGFRELGERVLLWIVFARRPLTTEELRHALAVKAGTSSLDTRSLYTAKDIVSSCAGLATIDGDSGIIRLVHYTTQEYFQRNYWKNFPNVQKDIIAATCLTYLSYDVFGGGYCSYWLDLVPRQKQNPFFDYAAQNWAFHAREVQGSVLELALKFLESDSKSSAASQISSIGKQPVCGIHLATYFDLKEIMEKLVKKNNLNIQDGEGRTPLSYAAETENMEMVRLLLENGAQINMEDNARRRPLSEAIEKRNTKIVQYLLSWGADLEYVYYYTPLSKAIEGGDDAVVELLLANGARPDAEDRRGWKPLSQAIEVGNAATVKHLLAVGIDVNYDYGIARLETPAGMHSFADLKKSTPLLRAVENGHAAIVKLLLAHNAQPDKSHKAGSKPLTMAIEAENATIVEDLLAIGVEVNYTFGATPLLRAAEKGSSTIVELLLKNGAQPDVEGIRDGWRPLSGAIESGNANIVSRLLTCGVDMHYSYKIPGGRGVSPHKFLTPLHHAVEKGDIVIAKILIDKGANLEAKNQWSLTPLGRAAVWGKYEDMVKLLVDEGADLEAKDEDDWTPLLSAASNGHEAVVKVLVSKGADIEAKNKRDQTPLSLAAGNGHEAVVKLLIDKGADTEARDNRDWTPLLFTASNGHEAVVKLLIDKGADTTLGSQIWLTKQVGFESFMSLVKDETHMSQIKDEIQRRKKWDEYIQSTRFT
ncbi:hypothetical protein TWF788_006346 [Orbilia oligospora]|uniref:NACHT domain-containing protein n=1 Tax=Orbilia oligospora TaxID=2813651 RepID=A0A7C8TVH0_ORBOL|nr:hypothetical protein TWF788_006346 [Orbilia oligospora]